MASIWGYALHGVEAIPVRVDAHVRTGLPGMTIVGLPGAAVPLWSSLEDRSEHGLLRALESPLPHAGRNPKLKPCSPCYPSPSMSRMWTRLKTPPCRPRATIMTSNLASYGPPTLCMLHHAAAARKRLTLL